MSIHGPGDMVGGRYEIAHHISEGGMQEVYCAHDTLLSRLVALKTPKTMSAHKRFKRSAASSASVNHINVAKTLDYLVDGSRFYLVEELIEGLDLGQLLRDYIVRFDPYACAHVLHHLAKGLSASHHAGIAHRDIKPSNIMIGGGLAFQSIKITDFGIAKMAEAELADANGGDGEGLTQSATALGALPYMAPEMIASFSQAALPADVWAVGALTYELLTGSKPFGTGYRAVPLIQAAILPPLPSELLIKPQFAELAGSISQILVECLRKDPSSRPDADALVSLCEKLCYSMRPRRVGIVGRMHFALNGFIKIVGEPEVFFHMDSVCAARVKPGDSVWFSSSPGEPRDRAFPVVPLRTATAAPTSVQ